MKICAKSVLLKIENLFPWSVLNPENTKVRTHDGESYQESWLAQLDDWNYLKFWITHSKAFQDIYFNVIRQFCPLEMLWNKIQPIFLASEIVYFDVIRAICNVDVKHTLVEISNNSDGGKSWLSPLVCLV